MLKHLSLKQSARTRLKHRFRNSAAQIQTERLLLLSHCIRPRKQRSRRSIRTSSLSLKPRVDLNGR